MGQYGGPNLPLNSLSFLLDAGNPTSYSGTGLTVYDLVSAGIGATLVNGVGFGTTNLGSFNFDGTNDYIQVPVNYIPTGNQVTLSFWNYGITSVPSSVFYSCDAGEIRQYNIHLPWNDSVVYWDCGGGASFNRINTAVLSASQWQGWHHWGFTKNITAGTMEIYLDGVLNTSGTGKVGTISAMTQAFIGRFQISSPLYVNNRVSHFEIYNRTLTADEIIKIYNATKGRYGL
jgi:hypothetical protein